MRLSPLATSFAFTTAVLGTLLVGSSSAVSSAGRAEGRLSPTPLILQENDGEHRLRRPGGASGSGSVPEFIIKVDKENGDAEDFYVGYEILKPGATIPFHKHHNSEEVVA